MKKIFENRFLFGSLCFIFGVLLTLGVQKAVERFHGSPQSRHQKQIGNFPTNFDGEAFPEDEEIDPFEEMRNLQQQMMQGMQLPKSDGAGQIETREDDQFIYYDITIKGMDPKSLQVNIEKGQITIAGQTENQADESKGGAYFSSEFHRSFPVPPETDADKVQVENSKDKVTLKFPKIQR